MTEVKSAPKWVSLCPKSCDNDVTSHRSEILARSEISNWFSLGVHFGSHVNVLLVSPFLNFSPKFFSFTLYHVLWPIVLSATWCLFRTAPKISKYLTKSIHRFYMLSKSVMEFHIMKLKCFSESKQITIFLMNLNCNWNTIRWKMKIIFRTSKRRPFLLGRTDQFWTYKRR